MNKINNISFKGIDYSGNPSETNNPQSPGIAQDKSNEIMDSMDALGVSARPIINSLDKQVEKLRQRLIHLNETTCNDEERFGKDGIESILELAYSEENIAIINAKLDELEQGKSIWTYDITSAIESKDDSRLSYASPFKEIHTTPSSNPEVISLEEKMKDMGYKANFSDNLETAKIITNAYEKMTKAGFRMPDEVILMTPKNEGVLGFRPYAPKGQRYSTPIYFNKDLSRKDDTPFMLSDIGIQHNSTNSSESVVYHEIGHFLNEETAPEPEIAIDIWKNETNDGLDLEMAREVGYYAMTGDRFHTGKEFVAEVFAGIMDGKHYSQRVMDLYYKLGGPKANM